MKKILLVGAKARFLVSIATACLALIVISSMVSLEGWREETKAYREWVSSGRPQLCAQIRSGTVSPREALAKILQGRTWEQAALPFDGLNPRCDPKWIERLSEGNPYARMFVEEECQLLGRKDGEKWLALSRAGCVVERSLSSGQYVDYSPPKSFPRFVWEEQIEREMRNHMLPFALVVTLGVLGVFLLLSTGRLYLTEAHLGWRRVSLLVSALASLVAPLSGLHRVVDDELGLAIASALAAFPLTILLVLGGKRVAGWVAVGFRPSAGTEGESSTVTVDPRHSNRSGAREAREYREDGQVETHGSRQQIVDGAEQPEMTPIGIAKRSRRLREASWLVFIAGVTCVFGLPALGIGKPGAVGYAFGQAIVAFLIALLIISVATRTVTAVHRAQAFLAACLAFSGYLGYSIFASYEDSRLAKAMYSHAASVAERARDSFAEDMSVGPQRAAPATQPVPFPTPLTASAARDAELATRLIGSLERFRIEVEEERGRHLAKVSRLGAETSLTPRTLTNRAALQRARDGLRKLAILSEQQYEKGEALLLKMREEMLAPAKSAGPEHFVRSLTEGFDRSAAKTYAHFKEMRSVNARSVEALSRLLDFMEERLGRTAVGPNNQVLFETRAEVDRYTTLIASVVALAKEEEALLERAHQAQNETVESLQALAKAAGR